MGRERKREREREGGSKEKERKKERERERDRERTRLDWTGKISRKKEGMTATGKSNHLGGDRTMLF